MIWDQFCIGLALLIVGLLLFGWAFALSVDDQVGKALLLFTGSICTIRQSGPFLSVGLKLNKSE